MGKSALCICKNKGADQLRGNRAADQRLCFRYKDSTISLLPKSVAIFCGFTVPFVSDLVVNSKTGFLMAQLIFEPRHEKTNILQRRKQRCRSASR